VLIVGRKWFMSRYTETLIIPSQFWVGLLNKIVHVTELLIVAGLLFLCAPHCDPLHCPEFIEA
jgi:hypothetical protein